MKTEPEQQPAGHKPWCASVPRTFDAQLGRGSFPCDCKPAGLTATASELEQLAREAARQLDPSKSANDSETQRRTKIIHSVCQKVQELTRKEGELQLSEAMDELKSYRDKSQQLVYDRISKLTSPSGKQEQWTYERLLQYASPDYSDLKQLASAINASIDAEREAYVSQREDWIREIQQLRSQLQAATWELALVQGKLAAAQAEIAGHNKRIRLGATPLEIDNNPTMLNEYVAKECQPLVSQLQVVLDCVDYLAGNCRVNEMVGATLDADVIRSARAELAKVKEGES